MIYFILILVLFLQSVQSYKQRIRKRSADDKTNINGTDKETFLNSSSGYFASKKTKIWSGKIDPNHPKKFILTLNSEKIMESVASFFQSIKTSSIADRVKKEGKSWVRMSDVPKHLRKSRDLWNKNISSTDYEKSGSLKNIDNRFRRSSELNVPQFIYPEIMIVVDDALFSRFNKSIEKSVQYILSFWNSVDWRFRAFKTPRIFVNIAGIILVEGPLLFEKDFLVHSNKNKIFKHECLDSFSKWLYREDKIRLRIDYDIAILMTGKDVINRDNSSSVAGYAILGGACKDRNAVGLIEDNGGFKGIRAGAHELAHLLGAPHDDDYKKKECSMDKSYIMSNRYYGRNQFHFSPCTEDKIASQSSLKVSECLRNNPSDRIKVESLPRILPGKLMTLDEQCIKNGYLAARHKNPSICLNLLCLEKPIGPDRRVKTKNIGAAADGSYCGNGMYCLDGKCIKEEPETDSSFTT